MFLKNTVVLALAFGAAALQDPVPGGVTRHFGNGNRIHNNRNLDRSHAKRVDTNSPIDWLHVNNRPRQAPTRDGAGGVVSNNPRWDGDMREYSSPMGMAFEEMGRPLYPFPGHFGGPAPPGPGPFEGAMRPPMSQPWPPVNPPWERGAPPPSQDVLGWTPLYNPDDEQRAKVIVASFVSYGGLTLSCET